jgi:hypothetical protein
MSAPRGTVAGAIREFEKLKKLADGALAQMDERAFFDSPGPETNCAALIVKHMAGNMRSRWTDFLTSDGEKPDRDRDTEFERFEGDTRAGLMRRWEEGWECLLSALRGLSDADLDRTVPIRGEPHTVLQAILRQLTHYPYHVGQIVLLARHYRGEAWKTLSVPRGKSREFNREMFGRVSPDSPERS